jgi:O-antigen/teichoic acid export membrane protein
LVGSLLALGLTGLAAWRPGWFGFISPRLLGVASISIPFQLITLVGLNIFLAVGRVGRFNLLDLAGQSFVLINAVVALAVLNAGLWTLISLNTAASVLIGLLIAVLVAAYGLKMKERRAWRPDLQLFGRMMRYGVKFHVSIVAAMLIFRVDLLLVNHIRGAGQAGVYSVASQVAMMLMLLPSVIATLLFPRIASAPEERRSEMTCVVTRHTAFIMLIICLLTLPLSLALPLLYGAAFVDATVQLWLLLPGVYLVSIESVLAQYFSASGLPIAIPLFWMATLVVNVALNIALVPGFGARGASLASTIAYAMIFVLVMLYFRRRTGHSISSTIFLRAAELRGLLKVRRFGTLSR